MSYDLEPFLEMLIHADHFRGPVHTPLIFTMHKDEYTKAGQAMAQRIRDDAEARGKSFTVVYPPPKGCDHHGFWAVGVWVKPVDE